MLFVLYLSTPGFGFDYVAVTLFFTSFSTIFHCGLISHTHFQAVRGLGHPMFLTWYSQTILQGLLCLNFNSWVILDSGLWA